MELARRQAALARLAVDAELRERFLERPSGAAAALGLAPGEAEELAAHVEGLPQFARSLLRKRLGAARSLLPRTAALLGERFDEHFLRYASAQPSRSPHRHERDALALAERLRPSLGGEELGMLQLETGWIEARLGRRLLVRRLASGGVAVWLRAGARLRHWRLGGGAISTNPAPDAQESR